jgi:hypothetical protein
MTDHWDNDEQRDDAEQDDDFDLDERERAAVLEALRAGVESAGGGLDELLRRAERVRTVVIEARRLLMYIEMVCHGHLEIDVDAAGEVRFRISDPGRAACEAMLRQRPPSRLRRS